MRNIGPGGEVLARQPKQADGTADPAVARGRAAGAPFSCRNYPAAARPSAAGNLVRKFRAL